MPHPARALALAIAVLMAFSAAAPAEAAKKKATRPAATQSRPAAKPKAKPARSYKVGKGETLGKIAARFQCDVPTLARANGLKAPAYSLRQGQSIKLQGCDK